ncbi:Transposon Tf2-6 polyprotein [Labeo rohita]|uniref:Transposon Tf2-6 polyprotein n=1 Tax=Labeo rohita TaxID=84645 RepID=A0ABQ8MHI0_LABRO|nr:Transposon Tf2-6 polyprotein [Labeo rohita]
MSTEAPPASDPLTELVNAFKAAVRPAPTPPSSSGCPMAMPATFAGEAAERSGYTSICNLNSSRIFFGEQVHSPEIRAAMALYEDSIGLESFLQRTTRVSQRLAACQPPVTAPQPTLVAACYPVPEPMQVDSTRLSRTERNRCNLLGLCLYCGNQGHLIRNCPVRPPCPVVSTIPSEVETTHLTLLPVTLYTAEHSLSVDSGSSGNFISQECLNQLQLSCQCHSQVYSVKTIQGKPLGRGKVRHSSPYITLQVGLFHTEDIRFLVLEDSTVSIVLGRPWLRQHLPELCWDPCDVIHSSGIDKKESPEPEISPEIPAEYVAFQDVFSKQAATHLPPHRPWDCAIELLPGVQLPKGRIYPLSIPEHQAMEEYIAEALKQGFIQTSTSPLRVSSSWARRMAVYVPASTTVNSTPRSSNNPILSPWSPPPSKSFVERIPSRSWTCQHVQQVLQKLKEHSLCLKLEKCKFHQPSVQFLGYNINAEGVQMDQGRNYSSITAPLTSLLRGKPKHLTWNPAAHKAFQRLKTIFSTAPLLHHPDPELPFTVEVDASTIGVGAVLSQAVGESSLLHPCAFFSHKLSLAEQNYDVGNQELLAIKLALEEWRHWLEGATHQFTIITDHKNLQYLREAKHLNPRQAR